VSTGDGGTVCVEADEVALDVGEDDDFDRLMISANGRSLSNMPSLNFARANPAGEADLYQPKKGSSEPPAWQRYTFKPRRMYVAVGVSYNIAAGLTECVCVCDTIPAW
jgi:hypothetical protein